MLRTNLGQVLYSIVYKAVEPRCNVESRIADLALYRSRDIIRRVGRVSVPFRPFNFMKAFQ